LAQDGLGVRAIVDVHIIAFESFDVKWSELIGQVGGEV